MILVTNKISATLMVKTKSGETFYIPPRVRGLKLDINSEDVVSSSTQLIISETRKRRSQKRKEGTDSSD